jgi:hypothetical protein
VRFCEGRSGERADCAHDHFEPIPFPFNPRGLNTDVQVRPDRPTPYRSRLRWPDPVTGRRRSVSHSRDTAEQARAWTALLVQAAEGGLDPQLVTLWLTKLTEVTQGALDPALSTTTLAEYGAANMDLILRGLDGNTRSVYGHGRRRASRLSDAPGARRRSGRHLARPLRRVGRHRHHRRLHRRQDRGGLRVPRLRPGHRPVGLDDLPSDHPGPRRPGRQSAPRAGPHAACRSSSPCARY